MRKWLENMAFQYLRVRNRHAMRNVDVNRPIQLRTQFRSEYTRDSASFEKLIEGVLGHIGIKRKPVSFVRTKEYRHFETVLDGRLSIFDNKPYQLGALDEEIHVIAELVYNLKMPSVLEIGVANGYSSAFLYFALKESGGRIFSIDMPKFPRRPIWPSEFLRRWLATRGRIENTGTLGDLNPGGMIPKEKYGGWLVPFHFRLEIPNIALTGNAFNIIPDFPEDLKFDFAVIDAMKDYEGRSKILNLVSSRLTSNGLCALDGYWVNQAFENFCRRNNKPSWKFGRVGLFANS